MTPVRRLLAPLMPLALVMALGTGCTDGRGGGAALSVQDFAASVAEPGTVVLDVRTPQEFADGHLPGALNVDATAPRFATRLGELDQEATYAVYCRTGSRSADAVEVMRRLGFSDVHHLDGGVSEWLDQGQQVVVRR